ncbi:Uncharacterised protein [Segatella copri]|nr:Uncharacterised protein [Segatella copri]
MQAHISCCAAHYLIYPEDLFNISERLQVTVRKTYVISLNAINHILKRHQPYH